MTSLFDYRVRVQVKTESPDAVLLDFLRNERQGSYSHKEMLLWALRAYWMPFAQQQSARSGQSEAQLRHIALSSIYQLEKHIDYIRETFGLVSLESTAKVDRQSSYRSDNLARSAIAPPPTAKPIDQWYKDEDDLFDSTV
jgi:hypothetical protein